MIAYTDETADVGGVAYMAHVGGFFAGLLLTFLFRGASSSQTTT
jgi:membrane associated rhomboid family serine protease